MAVPKSNHRGKAQRHGDRAPSARKRSLFALPLCLGASVVGLFGGAVATGGASAAHACVPSLQGDAVRVMRSEALTVAWRSEPAAIPLGEHFVLELAVCATGGGSAIDSIAVDAEMPEHRHGMNYRPGLASLGGGRYRAEGLLFHMPGRWRLTVEVRAGGSVERLTDDVMVE